MSTPAQLGATVEPGGVRFALAAPHAQAVTLCLFRSTDHTLIGQRQLQRGDAGVWHGFEPGLRAGALYGWRVHGPWQPAHGHRFNPAKLLLDPYAREVVGRYDGDDIHRGHVPDDPQQPDPRDNAATALKARVLADPPPLRTLQPSVDPARRVLYEVHLKAFTALHPDVPEALRGRYAGFAHPAAIAHFKRLGITTVCLMPLAQRADEPRLLQRGLSNHWGYNTIAWAAPESRYASAPERARDECRAMVEALHEAGLEVVLDVVFNHSAESDASGPTLSLRGIDNALYYHLPPEDRAAYANWAGCGNVLNLNQPLVLRLVMDSLRRWVSDYGIDGFRFDLAPILARGETPNTDFHPRAAFLMAVAQDPMLCNRLMIAEPWDIGPGGYRLGQFPPGWLEWNDRFRDTQRATWLRRSVSRGALGRSLAGSHEIFGHARPAHSSVNFVTSHDGFTLMDLVSYTERHNQANGEDNRDGHGHNLSVNHGVEGPTDVPAIQQARLRQRRALLAVLLLSLGTPMLLAGDELGHSQQGNNNAYCQDNATTWIHWSEADPALIDFVAQLIALRHELAPFFSAHWWRSADHGAGAHTAPVARWFAPGGAPMTAADWEEPQARPLMLEVAACGDDSPTALWLLNPTAETHPMQLPPGAWRQRLDTHAGHTLPAELAEAVDLPPGCLWLAVRSETC
jgi:glycogen debranching enzyme